MNVLVLLSTFAVQVSLAVGFLIACASIGWMLWDCSVGPSARAAKAARRQARGVGA